MKATRAPKSILVAHSGARVAGGAPPANAPLDVIDRQDLTTRERDFLRFVGSLGAPLSDARALELFHMSVANLIVELQQAGLEVPAELLERAGPTEVADVLEPLDAVPLFEQIIPQRRSAPRSSFLTTGLAPSSTTGISV